MRFFASDNCSGVAPEIMQALINANHEHEPSYGNDGYTQTALALFKQTFGAQSTTYFAYNGTAANVAGLSAMLRSHHAILCAEMAHIATQEVGAATQTTGCPTLLIPSHDGKITAAAVQHAYDKASYWKHHTNLPKLVSITQSTELGTIYTPEELKAIQAVCKKNGLYLHMDGCRLSNAAAALKVSLAALTREVGVDVLSFGGTKNGLMFGEAIVFINPIFADEFAHVHKQRLQLNSKMRFISAQFIPYLKEQLWHRYANHANQMCQRLTAELLALPGVKLAYPQQTNLLFIHMPETMIQATQAAFPFHVWDKGQNIVRLVTSFDNTEQDILAFIQLAKGSCA